MTFKTSNLEELILPLRIQIGDNIAVPVLSDETLHAILRMAVADLMRRWSDKYYLDNDGVVHRNPNITFDWSSPPVVQHKDRRPIVLQASIAIKSGAKFANSGNAVSWRDEEISYSSIEAARQRSSTLADDIAELENLLPGKKLAQPLYGRLYGHAKDWE
jgi:hypothetical protein